VIGGLILAAGEGTRFGSEPKLLAELEGRPLLEHAIRAQCAVPALERVVVVLGADAERVLKRVDFLDAEPVVCADWGEGQAASLRRGVEELAGADKVIITLGDEPLLTPQVIARFVDESAPARATYEGRPGHPVALGREQLAAVRGLSGDSGARELLGAVRMLECGHLCSGRDVDTPHDLEAIRSEARAVI
jgi:molybdenum cofactor cytidylyltransferase/nicotine blue oxidoreductase